MRTLKTPSADLPGPPALSIEVPEGWEPLIAPGTALGAVEPAGAPGVRTNVVVTVSRFPAPYSLDQAVDAVRTATAALPEAVLNGSRVDRLRGRPSLVHEVAFRHPSGAALVQCHVAFLAEAGPAVDMVHVVGTIDGTRAAEGISDLRRAAVSVAEVGPQGRP